MSQMRTSGFFNSQKEDCGMQNIESKICEKKLRKYSIYLALYGQI